MADSVGINATFIYDQMISDTQLPQAGGAAGPLGATFYDMAWRRFQAFLGARWFL